MKKTFTINISGIIFHIDEDAYEKLNGYLGILKSHFKTTDGQDEIISDIEGRVAELLQERMQEQKQVVTIEDIDEIIEIMGQPSDFIEDDAEPHEEQASTSRASKRLYRDPDNQIIGGVCSGIAAYFNVDALWVRIIFLILLLGFISPIIYLVLWAVIPKARTTAEKLEMKGEKVNVSNIEKSIQDELHNLKDKINDLTSKTKDSLKKKEGTSNTVIEDFFGFILSILKIILRIVVIIAGVILFIIGLSFLVGFIVSFFGWGGFMYFDNHDLITLPFPSIIGLISNDIESVGLLRVGLLMFLGIPIIMLIYGAFRMIFRIEGIRHIGFAAFNIWIIGLIITLFFTFKIGRNFKHDVTVKKPVEFVQPAVDTLSISANQIQIDAIYDEYGNNIYLDEPNLVITEEGKIFSYVRLRIRKSPDDNYHFTKHIYSKGRTSMDAEENTNHTIHYIQLTDSTMVIDPLFIIEEGESWHDQQINLELQVPLYKAVKLDWNLRNILRHHGYYSTYHLPGKTWVMTDDGLKKASEVPEPEEPEPTSKLNKPRDKQKSLTFIMLQNVMAI